MTVARHHIQLEKVDQELYIKNLDVNGEVTIVRGKKKQFVEMESMLMKSNDVVMVGNTSLKITII